MEVATLHKRNLYTKMAMEKGYLEEDLLESWIFWGSDEFLIPAT